MLIPIGHEDQRVARLPWATILLVAANVVAFLLTLPLVQEHAAKTRQRVQEIVRFAVEHPYLQLPEELAHLVPAMPPPFRRTDRWRRFPSVPWELMPAASPFRTDRAEPGICRGRR